MADKERITINDIATIAGVAKSTVSRYLNNGSVSEKMRQKLDAVIAQYDYEPNVFAQSLRKSHSGLIGVVVPTFASYALTEMMRGLDAANEGDFFLTINTYHDVNRQLEAVKTLALQNVDGIVLLTGQITPAMAKVLANLDIPVVIQGQQSEQQLTVNVDNYLAGQQVAALLTSYQANEILLVGVDPLVDENVGKVRMQAIYERWPNEEVPTVITTFLRQDAYKAVRTYLQHQSKPKAVVAATDSLAIAAMQALSDCGVDVQHDVNIIGFDGTPDAEITQPPLTTVQFDYFALGQALYQRLKAQHPELLTDPLLPGKIIQRASWRQ